MVDLIIWIIFGSICGAITYAIGNEKGISGGFWYGFFLGILGIIIIICMRVKEKSVEHSKVDLNDMSENVSENKEDKFKTLERLHELKTNGAITEEEFNFEKQKILSWNDMGKIFLDVEYNSGLQEEYDIYIDSQKVDEVPSDEAREYIVGYGKHKLYVKTAYYSSNILYIDVKDYITVYVDCRKTMFGTPELQIREIKKTTKKEDNVKDSNELK